MKKFYHKSVAVMFVMAVGVLAFAVSCTKSADLTADVDTESVADSQFSVSEEEAIAMLSKDLDAIYGESDQTRTASARRIKNIQGVKLNRAALSTRSESIPDDVEDLLYVVEFEDGQGSAVLGADKRVEPVFAILDKTVLTAQDIENSIAADADRNDLTTFVASMIYNSAMSQVSTYERVVLPPFDLKTTRYETRYDTLYYEKKLPLLDTKWDQDYPFNNNCNGYPAGCGVIAVAQIMKYHQYPNPLVIDGQTFSWTNINNYTYPNISWMDEDVAQVGGFIRALGDKMGADYTSGNSGTSSGSAKTALQNLGYTTSNLTQYSNTTTHNNTIINEVRANRPVFFRGQDGNDGHAWVIDGLLRYSVEEWLYEIETDPLKIAMNGTDIVNTTYVATTSVGRLHCNYGWNGLCDGYYSYGVFDTTTHLNQEWVESSTGDVSGIRGYDFDIYLMYFTVNVEQ